jgi:hypothetical protein
MDFVRERDRLATIEIRDSDQTCDRLRGFAEHYLDRQPARGCACVAGGGSFGILQELGQRKGSLALESRRGGIVTQAGASDCRKKNQAQKWRLSTLAKLHGSHPPQNTLTARLSAVQESGFTQERKGGEGNASAAARVSQEAISCKNTRSARRLTQESRSV